MNHEEKAPKSENVLRLIEARFDQLNLRVNTLEEINAKIAVTASDLEKRIDGISERLLYLEQEAGWYDDNGAGRRNLVELVEEWVDDLERERPRLMKTPWMKNKVGDLLKRLG